MPRLNLSGQLEPTVAAGVKVLAFVPAPLPPPGLTVDAGLRSKLEAATLALGRLQGMSAALPEARWLLPSIVRREAVLSSQIEGTRSTFAELLAHEAQAVAAGPELDDLEETEGALRSMRHGLKRTAEGFPLSVRLLREMHAELMGPGSRGSLAAAGELRRSQNWVGGPSPDKAAHVPPPHRVGACLSALERYWHADEPQGLVAKVALAHAQFESIHPFLDGNGRLGRQLVLLMLIRDGVLQGPWLWLSLALKRTRPDYYRLLNGTRRSDGWVPWLAYFADALLAAAEDGLAKAAELRTRAAQDQARVVEHGRRQLACILLHESFCRRPVMNVKQACEATGLATNGVVNGLGILEHLGLVKEISGRKRGRLFAYQTVLEVLDPATRGKPN